MRDPANNVMPPAPAPAKVIPGQRLKASTINALIDGMGSRIIRTGGMQPLLRGADDWQGHFWLEVYDSSTVRVHGGTWVRHTHEGVRVVALTCTGGPSGLYADYADVTSISADGYIIITLTDVIGYSNALNPDTLTASYSATYPTADSTDTVICLGKVTTSGGAVVSVEQFWHGGDVEDFCSALNPACPDTVPITALADPYKTQLLHWDDASSYTKDPAADDGYLVFRYDGDGLLYYVDPADCGPVYDNASINDNSSVQWQIYGFETAYSSPPILSNLFPYKAGGVISWTDLSDLADVIAPELPEAEHSHHSLVAHDAETMSDGDGQGEYDDHGGQARLDGAGYTAGLDIYRYMLLGTYTDRATTYARNLPPSGGADDASCIGDSFYVQHEGHFGDDGADIFKADLAIDTFWAGHFVDGVCTANLATGTEAGQFHDGSISVKLAVHGGAAVEVVAGDVTIDPAYSLCFGDPTDADTWRIAVSGGALVFERYDGAAWVEGGRFATA